MLKERDMVLHAQSVMEKSIANDAQWKSKQLLTVVSPSFIVGEISYSQGHNMVVNYIPYFIYSLGTVVPRVEKCKLPN